MRMRGDSGDAAGAARICLRFFDSDPEALAWSTGCGIRISCSRDLCSNNACDLGVSPDCIGSLLKSMVIGYRIVIFRSRLITSRVNKEYDLRTN